MKLNFLFFNARTFDGYGRYSLYLIRALRKAGVTVFPHFIGAADAPDWLRNEWGIDFDIPTISCLPPFYLRKVPGRHWLITMTEGSELPLGWREAIETCNVERVIVPCEHNAKAFREGGVECPVSVIHGGTDPDEFPLITREFPREKGEFPREFDRPYTFLTLADRGKRKGWFEVYNAFFMAFGTAQEMGPDKVRLIIKCRPKGNDLIDLILEKCPWIDPRITFLQEDMPNIADFYRLGDCLALPSRSEGWGMPHREAAMMGLPVITQAYSGMDDGHTDKWALVVEGGRMEPVEVQKDKRLKGQWRTVDREELAEVMRWCYDHRAAAVKYGQHAATWLRLHQTWDVTSTKLLQLLQQEGVLAREREYA